jgi:hypothetical protein
LCRPLGAGKKWPADEVTNAVKAVLMSDEKSIPAGIQDVMPEDGLEKVVGPDVLKQRARAASR